MSDITDALQRGAKECEREGVAGWGNTMADAAGRLATLEAERDELRAAADWARGRASDLAANNERLAAEVGRLRTHGDAVARLALQNQSYHRDTDMRDAVDALWSVLRALEPAP